MPTSIRQLLDEASDCDLCSGVFTSVVDHYGDAIDASTLPDEHRVVLLVWHSLGIIGNGGFNYLFEGSFDGDPQFLLTAKAFRDIDCRPAAEAFENAFDLFPDAKPPTDISRRLEIYGRGTGETRHEINSRFFAAMGQIEKCLAAFIRDHHEQFRSLDRTKPKRRKRVQPAPKPDPTSPSQILAGIPHWLRVAFAARCARHVLPIFEINWPNAPEEHRNAVVTAILAAEKSAATARASAGLEGELSNVKVTAGAALMPALGAPIEFDDTGPPDGNMASVAFLVVKAAENAAEAAHANPDESDTFALEALVNAREAAGDDHRLVTRMYDEMDQLHAIASDGKWTHRSAVPTDLFNTIADRIATKAKPWWKFW